MWMPLTVWITTNCGKFLRYGLSDNLTSLLRNLCAGQEVTVWTLHGTTDWFKIGKGVRQGCILSPWSFNFYAEYIMWNPGLVEAQAGIKTVGRNINNHRYADDATLMEESEEEWKSLLMRIKEESEKAGSKLSIQKTKIMASVPIISWQIDWETMETARDSIFSSSKVIASMKLRHLLLGRKAMTNLDSILKSKDITCDKGPFCQSYGFPSSHIQIWELDHKEVWAMLLNCVVLEKSLESPSDCKEIKSLWNPKWNQAWIFIGRTNTKAEAPILWPPDVKNQLVGNDPDAGKDWGQENGMKEGKMVGCHHKLNGLEFEQTPGDSEGQGSLVWCSPWGHKESDTT